MSLPLAWDRFDGYLFDIDGTLLHCADAVHYFAFCDALSSVAGRRLNLDGVVAHGNTDVGILRDAFTLAGVSPQHWRPRLGEICDAMCSQVEQRKSELSVTTLPQVREILLHLRKQGALLSVATGNLERIGKQKLAAADLLDLFHLGAWSDGLEYREDVFRQGVARLRGRLGNNAAILAFGDTPADIAAALANDLPIVAVATGIYSYETLAAESPSLCLRSFSDLLE